MLVLPTHQHFHRHLVSSYFRMWAFPKHLHNIIQKMKMFGRPVSCSGMMQADNKEEDVAVAAYLICIG